jgi:hypothetical protein
MMLRAFGGINPHCVNVLGLTARPCHTTEASAAAHFELAGIPGDNLSEPGSTVVQTYDLFTRTVSLMFDMDEIIRNIRLA